jgi:hypothetical protein
MGAANQWVLRGVCVANAPPLDYSQADQDAAKVMSRYACGLGILILEDKVSKFSLSARF